MNFDFVIIGGGMVGLTIAHQLIEKDISINICIVDKETSLGAHSSGRNSGVLHAGIYYKPGSTRAKVCIDGAKRLKQWIDYKKLPIKNCGKIIVPQKYELDNQIDNLYNRGIKNGAVVEIIDQKQISELAPYVVSSSGRALWSPKTSVVNPISIIKSLENDLKSKGITFLYGESDLVIHNREKKIHLKNNQFLNYGHLINCAGLQSDKIAHQFGVAKEYYLVPFKGIYWGIKKEFPFRIKTNIYPVPDLKMPFLGIHFTPTFNDEFPVSIGPTANLALGRENYNSFDRIEPISTLRNISLLLNQYFLNKGNFRNYFHEQAFLSLAPLFLKEAKKLVPSLKPEYVKLSKKVGIRSQVFNKKTEKLEDDFLCINGQNSTHLLNVISPAFTASFSFADLVISKLEI